eukprot:tig00021728_g23301.t1
MRWLATAGPDPPEPELRGELRRAAILSLLRIAQRRSHRGEILRSDGYKALRADLENGPELPRDLRAELDAGLCALHEAAGRIADERASDAFQASLADEKGNTANLNASAEFSSPLQAFPAPHAPSAPPLAHALPCASAFAPPPPPERLFAPAAPAPAPAYAYPRAGGPGPGILDAFAAKTRMVV